MHFGTSYANVEVLVGSDRRLESVESMKSEPFFTRELRCARRARNSTIRKVTALLVAVICLGACSSSGHNVLFDLDGTWKGQIRGFQAPGLVQQTMNYDLWLTIRNDKVDLWYLWEGQWVRLWNGAREFTIVRHKSNAVIFASNSKPQTECHWVETWSLTVSQFRPDSLETFWYRVVNNTGCPEYDDVQFAYGAAGQLHRISPEATVLHP